MLDGHDIAVRSQQWSDDFSGFQSLLDIEVTRRFVEHVSEGDELYIINILRIYEKEGRVLTRRLFVYTTWQ